MGRNRTREMFEQSFEIEFFIRRFLQLFETSRHEKKIFIQMTFSSVNEMSRVFQSFVFVAKRRLIHRQVKWC